MPTRDRGSLNLLGDFASAPAAIWRDLLGDHPSVAQQMQGLDTAQRAALASGGVGGMMRDPALAQQATDLAGQLDLLGPIKAYHGTPHTFAPEPGHPHGRFRMDMLGTGEGAQAYGHGLYFAEEPKVAEGYRKALSPGAGASAADTAARIMDAAGGDKARALEIVGQRRKIANMPGAQESFDEVQRIIESGRNLRGSVYEVELGMEHEDLLDWDLPLSKQPPKVREAIQPLLDSMTEERLKSRRALAAKFQAAGAPNPLENVEDVWGKSTGRQLVNLLRDKIGSPDAASRALREAGIPGIRYLDAGSRGGEGTRNVVLFDEALARIQGRR